MAVAHERQLLDKHIAESLRKFDHLTGQHLQGTVRFVDENGGAWQSLVRHVVHACFLKCSRVGSQQTRY